VSGPARRCCFPEAVSRRVAGCTKAHKTAKQYRRIVHCLDKDAHDRCAAWLNQVRQASRFTLGTAHTPGALPRAAAGRLQCGGLLGMGDLLEGATVQRIDDVANLTRRAVTRYESLDRVPLQTVIQRVHEYGSQE
jgi:hypothetical protein